MPDNKRTACLRDQVRNPDTGRCVKRSGKVGKEVQLARRASSGRASSGRASSGRRASSDRIAKLKREFAAEAHEVENVREAPSQKARALSRTATTLIALAAALAVGGATYSLWAPYAAHVPALIAQGRAAAARATPAVRARINAVIAKLRGVPQKPETWTSYATKKAFGLRNAAYGHAKAAHGYFAKPAPKKAAPVKRFKRAAMI